MRDLDPRTVNLRTLPIQISRRGFVLNALFVQNNFRHAVKDKGVSHDTMEDRRQYIYRAFHYLEHNDIKSFKPDPRSLGDRHVRFLFADMERRAGAGQLGPSAIQKAHSYLRTFAGWIGKPGLVLPISAYISDETLYRRSYVTKHSKAWDDNGVVPEEVIAAVANFDERVAVQIELMKEFGLRCKEAVMFRPNQDIVTAAQAGKAAAGTAEYLQLRRGTKGGRLRYVPVVTPSQLVAIEHARRVAPGENDSLSDPRYQLVRAIRHQRYVMELFGLTKAMLGVTAHGLRHGYAAERYEAETGVAPPVATAERADVAVDLAARRLVSESLGHSRSQITSVYLGSSRGRA
ncbi:MAG: integrase domain-containing protein [Piscinibacter sp.]|uniref:integrase domain-containing protein n=1 Tax=Piscinibacter sp. TaxID=1903157 RepID=UPI001B4AF415|nr:integrase domain-containing protein [Piscinibacter sp.]MBP5988789.1 integrase domain-containing protein [Piscinibacter sp.]MBP6025722.1 integrase domain-containing protein [Piscinibacter sp.]